LAGGARARGVGGAEEGVGEAGGLGGGFGFLEKAFEFAAGGEAAAAFFGFDHGEDGGLDVGLVVPGEEVVEGAAADLGEGAQVVLGLEEEGEEVGVVGGEGV
jgi:hypothetical protein